MSVNRNATMPDGRVTRTTCPRRDARARPRPPRPAPGGRGVPPTLRAPLYAEHGAVAAPHALASLAGLEVLKEGGNALDAAIAANATLGVVWPHMCGPGGDLFLQLWWARDRAL